MEDVRSMAANTLDEFWLNRGGPFHRLERGVGLVREAPDDPRRLAKASVLLGWVPLALLSVLDLARGRPAPLMLSLQVHAVTLVALPLFFWSEAVIDWRVHHALSSLNEDHFLSDSARQRLERIVQSAERWRSSWILELVIYAVALANGVLLVFGARTPLFPVPRQRFAPEEVYYFIVVLPLVHFVALRLIVRWLIWIGMLVGIARTPLSIEPLHPDRAGGLAPMHGPSVGFGVWLAGLSTMIAAGWGDLIVQSGENLRSFEAEFTLFVGLGVVAAAGPLLLFFPQLRLARTLGRLHYGSFATGYCRSFRARWLGPVPESKEVLGTPDLQSLADLGNSLSFVEKMRPVPFGTELLLELIYLMVVPMLPLSLSAVSVTELLTRVGKVVLGAPPI
jgi:hypothetical protein